ncbi:hypothetical protein BFG57_06810 [Bacillus solimangrovi]|uniref:Zinc finger CGNR domain-containing protein n=2 Tax=Bacillus solimangrovi TaxID=1305675 RepID=A0A1E5LAM9_9BACI|nr:hypothetical protein BFG57_06810 [Bacillus solimangrovi]
MIDGLKNLRKLCFLILNELKNNGTIQKTKKSAYQQFQDFVAHLSVNVSINIDPEIQMVVIGKTKQDDVLLKISKSIIQTITEVKPERIRKCENKKCILHFVDYSKNGKRRWCRMETCGNRHKAKTFYEKKKETKR